MNGTNHEPEIRQLYKSLSASTVQWKSLDPCTSLSESDLKQYTNLEFCEKGHKHFKNILIYKAK